MSAVSHRNVVGHRIPCGASGFWGFWGYRIGGFPALSQIRDRLGPRCSLVTTPR